MRSCGGSSHQLGVGWGDMRLRHTCFDNYYHIAIRTATTYPSRRPMTTAAIFSGGMVNGFSSYLKRGGNDAGVVSFRGQGEW